MAETLTGAQIICRVLEEQGVDVLFGYPGGAIMPFYHALPEYPGAPPHPGAARAGRGARRRRLRPGERPAGGLRGHVGAGCHQPGDRPRDRAHGQLAGRRHHRPGEPGDDRAGRVPGNRRHRRHPADHQAQRAGAGHRGARRHPARGVRDRGRGATGAGAGGRAEGRAESSVRNTSHRWPDGQMGRRAEQSLPIRPSAHPPIRRRSRRPPA